MEIKSLPFYYKSHPAGDNGGLPHTMPFDLFYDEDLHLVRQRPSKALADVLEKVYIEGSLVDGSVSSESGLHYVTPVMDYIFSRASLKKNSKILEIGFGAGIFLGEFKKMGYYNLTGIEPGNHQMCKGLEGVNLISDFYPSAKYSEKVDLIFHCLVLEHIEEPSYFLSSQKSQLSEDGKIIFFVPNEEPFLDAGDCSSFIHEHFSFFTKNSVVALAGKAGMKVEDISIIEGLLAVTLVLGESSSNLNSKPGYFDYNGYLQKVEANLGAIQLFLNRYSLPSDVVLYVPGRAMNFMYLLNCPTPRLVDDSSEVQGKFLPFLERPVESFQSIIQDPPKAILIFSRTFGHKIKKKCTDEAMLRNCDVYTLDEILDA